MGKLLQTIKINVDDHMLSESPDQSDMLAYMDWEHKDPLSMLIPMLNSFLAYYGGSAVDVELRIDDYYSITIYMEEPKSDIHNCKICGSVLLTKNSPPKTMYLGEYDTNQSKVPIPTLCMMIRDWMQRMKKYRQDYLNALRIKKNSKKQSKKLSKQISKQLSKIL